MTAHHCTLSGLECIYFTDTSARNDEDEGCFDMQSKQSTVAEINSLGVSV